MSIKTISKNNTLTLSVSVKFDSKQAQLEFNKLKKQLETVSNGANKKIKDGSDTAAKSTDKLNKKVKEQTGLWGKLGKTISGAATSMVTFMAVGAVIMAVTNQIKQLISLMFELDKAYTNLKIVTKLTAVELQEVDIQISKVSTSLAKMKKEVVEAVTEFARAGYAIKESMELAENAIMASNVGATELTKVTTFLIAGLKSFNMEADESGRILDVLFRVANTTAINLEGIGEAFLRSANTLKMAGATLEQSAALIAGANEAIQDPAKVGTALKTISARIRGIGKEGEAIPTLAKDFKQVGIEIQNADGSFKNVYDVFQEFSKVYKDLDDLTKESLLEKMAGKRQKNILIAMLDNFDTVEQAVKDAYNSTGEVADANIEYMKSLEGITNTLKETWNQFLLSIKGSDQEIKNALIGLTKLIGLVEKGYNLTLGVQLKKLFKKLSGDTDYLIENVTNLKLEIEMLDDEIASMESVDRVDKLTSAELIYLDTLKQQLIAKQELRAENEIELSKTRSKNIEKESPWKDLNKAMNKIDYFGLDSDKAQKAINKSMESLVEIKSNLIDYKLEILEANKVLDVNSSAYQTNSDSLLEIDNKLNAINQAYKDWGRATKVSTGAVEDNTQAIDNNVLSEENLYNIYDEVARIVGSTVEEHELLNDALAELTENGYLSADSLEEVQLAFTDIVKATGLSKDALETYTKADKELRISIINTQIDTLNHTIMATFGRIEAMKAEMTTMTALENLHNILAGRTTKGDNIKAAELEIQNAKNAITLLQNARKGLLKPVPPIELDTPSDTTSSSSTKTITLLTEQEILLKSINFQIEMQQKLLARTQEVDKKIAINKKLIDLYNQQRDALLENQVALDKEGLSIKKTDEAYEDFIDRSHDLSLAIEDSTNNIYELSIANKELMLTLKEIEKEITESNIEDIIKSINDEIENQIKFQEDLKKTSNDYYDGLIQSKQDELDALRETNDELDNRLKLENMLLDLQALRERRQNILDNKKARIVKDSEVGFEYITNPAELKSVNEDILNAEKDIVDFRRELLQEKNEKKIQSQIEELELQKYNESKNYNDRINELELFQNNVENEIEIGSLITLNLVKQLGIDLGLAEGESYKNRLGSLDSFIVSYNVKMAQLNKQKASITSLTNSIKKQQTTLKNTKTTTTPVSSDSTKSSSNVDSNSKSVLESKVRYSGVSTTSIPTTIKNHDPDERANTSTTTINTLNVKSNAKDLTGIIKNAARYSRHVK